MTSVDKTAFPIQAQEIYSFKGLSLGSMIRQKIFARDEMTNGLETDANLPYETPQSVLRKWILAQGEMTVA